jgi:hypothetical protein
VGPQEIQFRLSIQATYRHIGGQGVARKLVVKAVLSKEQKQILTELSTRLGTSESETIRMALMDYAKELNIMAQALYQVKK